MNNRKPGLRAKRLTALLLAGYAGSACQDTSESAGDPATTSYRPPPGAKEVLREPVSVADGLEVIVSDVVIPPGGSVPAHHHPAEEIVYVIEGSAIHVESGKPERSLVAGDSLVIPPGAGHAPRGGPDGARAIVVRLHRAGEPETIPAAGPDESQ